MGAYKNSLKTGTDIISHPEIDWDFFLITGVRENMGARENLRLFVSVSNPFAFLHLIVTTETISMNTGIILLEDCIHSMNRLLFCSVLYV